MIERLHILLLLLLQWLCMHSLVLGQPGYSLVPTPTSNMPNEFCSGYGPYYSSSPSYYSSTSSNYYYSPSSPPPKQCYCDHGCCIIDTSDVVKCRCYNDWTGEYCDYCPWGDFGGSSCTCPCVAGRCQTSNLGQGCICNSRNVVGDYCDTCNTTMTYGPTCDDHCDCSPIRCDTGPTGVGCIKEGIEWVIFMFVVVLVDLLASLFSFAVPDEGKKRDPIPDFLKEVALKFLIIFSDYITSIASSFLCFSTVFSSNLAQNIVSGIIVAIKALLSMLILFLYHSRGTWTPLHRNLYFLYNTTEIAIYILLLVAVVAKSLFDFTETNYIIVFSFFLFIILLEKFIEIFVLFKDIKLELDLHDKTSPHQYFVRILPYNYYQQYSNFGLSSYISGAIVIVLLEVMFVLISTDNNQCIPFSDNILQNVAVASIPILNEVSYTKFYWVLASIINFIIVPVLYCAAIVLACICQSCCDEKKMDSKYVYNGLFNLVKYTTMAVMVVPLLVLIFTTSFTFSVYWIVIWVVLLVWPISGFWRGNWIDGSSVTWQWEGGLFRRESSSIQMTQLPASTASS